MQKKAEPLKLTLCIALFACIAGAADSVRFFQLIEQNPSAVWAQSLDAKTKDSVNSYVKQAKLPNGLLYGNSVRNFDLSKLCDSQIKSWASKRGCEEKDDVLKRPEDNQPIHDSHGKTVPLISFLCKDGGVIRMKPIGDPTSKYPNPSVVKALRYFGSDRYDDFSDEAFKVDNQGRAVPKWGKDLNTALPGLEDEQVKKAYFADWGRDSHTELKICR
jgi:hypothetical protein